METAGRAVVFSGTTVAIGLLALVALPLRSCARMGYRRAADPAGQHAGRASRCCRSCCRARQPARLAAPAHRRPAPPLLDAVGASSSSATAGSRPARRCDPRALLIVAATGLHARRRPTPTRSPSRATRRPASSRWRTPASASGALLPYEIARRGNSPLTASRRRCAGVPGMHGAVAPDAPPWRQRAARRGPRVPDADDSTQAGQDTSTDVRDGGPRGRAGRPCRRPTGAERRLHRRRLRQLPADDRVDRDRHVPPARARVPLAAAAAQGGRAERAQRRRRLGRAGAGVAARPRVGPDLGNPGHRLDAVVDPADGVRVPVRALDGLRGLHPLAHARGVRRHRRHRRRGRAAASAAPAGWSRARR